MPRRRSTSSLTGPRAAPASAPPTWDSVTTTTTFPPARRASKLTHNEALKSDLKDAETVAQQPSSSPFGDTFAGPELWTKLTADPTTRAYLQQSDFLKMMQEIQKNPSSLNLHLKDERVMQGLGVSLNVKIRTRNSAEDFDVLYKQTARPPEKKRPAEAKPLKEEPEPQPEPPSEEERETREKKALAQKEKKAGNAAYKKKVLTPQFSFTQRQLNWTMKIFPSLLTGQLFTWRWGRYNSIMILFLLKFRSYYCLH